MACDASASSKQNICLLSESGLSDICNNYKDIWACCTQCLKRGDKTKVFERMVHKTKGPYNLCHYCWYFWENYLK